MRRFAKPFCLLVLMMGCGKETEQAAPLYYYVASGNTFAGLGVTMSAPSNTIVRYDSSGKLDRVLVDYTLNAGDTPVAMYSYDSQNLMVLIENATNTGARRMELVKKDGSGTSVFLFNSAAFGAATSILQDVVPTLDGGFLVSRGAVSANAAVEKFTSSKARVLIGANPYVNNPASPCNTAQTRFPRLLVAPTGELVLAHAAASPNNKLLLIKADGYSAASDCLAGPTTPTVNHYPTAMVWHAGTSKLLVAYGNNTGPVHSIYAYDLSATGISNGAEVYRNVSVLQGISTMTIGPDGSLFVASAATAFNTVEKLTHDGTTWTRAAAEPVIAPSVYTRSISGIVVAP